MRIKNPIHINGMKNKKSDIRDIAFLCTRQDSNLRPFGPEPNALSPELRVHKGCDATALSILHGNAALVKYFRRIFRFFYSPISTRGNSQISAAY